MARLSRLLDYSRLVRRGFRLVAPEPRGGEVSWEGGEWGYGGGWKHLHVSDVFELGFAAPEHEQDLHMHSDSYEVYFFLGRGRLEYIGERGCLESVEVGAGDVVIVPPGLYHRPIVEEGGLYAVLVPPSSSKRVYSGEAGPCIDG